MHGTVVKQAYIHVIKNYKNVHGSIPQDLLKRFEVLNGETNLTL